MRTISIESIDKDEWAKYIDNHPNGNIFQSPDMYEVYEDTKRYEPIFFAVTKDEKIVGTILAIIMQEMEGILRSLSSRALVNYGPLFDNTLEGIDGLGNLLNEFDNRVKKKVLYSEFRNLCKIPKGLNNYGYNFEDWLGAFISLKCSKEDLWSRLKRDKRRGIQKAKDKFDLQIEETTDISALKDCYELLQNTFKRAKHPLADITLFKSALNILGPKKRVRLLFALKNGERIAVQVALYYKGFIHAWYTGTKEEHLNHHPGDLLIWHMLEYGNENGYHTFDFGGGGLPQEDYSPRDYKSRFGTEFPNYGRFKKIYSPMKMKLAEKGFKLYKKML